MRIALTKRAWAKRLLAVGAATASLAGGTLAGSVAPAQAATANVGYACAYYVNVSMFGTPQGRQGCAPQTSTEATANTLSPSVTLPSSGAAQSATDNDGAKSVYGPAIFFSSPYDAADNLTNSGQLTTSTSGGTVVSSMAQAKAVGPSPFWTKTPTSWQTAPDVGYVKATCTASATGSGWTVTIHNGVVDTSTDSQGYPTSQSLVPENPGPGYRVPFTINNVGDSGIIVFNEYVANGDGSFTVNAAHMYMQGPSAVGDMIIGQVTCGHV